VSFAGIWSQCKVLDNIYKHVLGDGSTRCILWEPWRLAQNVTDFHQIVVGIPVWTKPIYEYYNISCICITDMYDPIHSWLTLRFLLGLWGFKLHCFCCSTSSDLPDLWPSHCRMVVLETRQTEDQSGRSNLYVLEIAENYVMLPWLSCLLAGASWETPRRTVTSERRYVGGLNDVVLHPAKGSLSITDGRVSPPPKLGPMLQFIMNNGCLCVINSSGWVWPKITNRQSVQVI